MGVIRTMPTWAEAAFAGLHKLRELKANWDGYNSPPVDPALLSQAEDLVSAIELNNAPTPSVCPAPGGGLQLEWQHAGRELEIEILPDHSVQYLTVAGEKMREGTLPPKSTAADVQRLLRWLIQG